MPGRTDAVAGDSKEFVLVLQFYARGLFTSPLLTNISWQSSVRNKLKFLLWRIVLGTHGFLDYPIRRFSGGVSLLLAPPALQQIGFVPACVLVFDAEGLTKQAGLRCTELDCVGSVATVLIVHMASMALTVACTSPSLACQPLAAASA